jgi:hypothetical protein
VSNSTNERTQLIQEIEQFLVATKDLWPFISAWPVIQARFLGVDELGADLDPVTQVHSLLMRENSRTALITEELFFAWLKKLPVLNKNIVCVDTGRVWEPVSESFCDFRSGSSSGKLQISNRICSDEKINEFYQWVVNLCNWDSSDCSDYLTKEVTLH